MKLPARAPRNFPRRCPQKAGQRLCGFEVESVEEDEEQTDEARWEGKLVRGEREGSQVERGRERKRGKTAAEKPSFPQFIFRT